MGRQGHPARGNAKEKAAAILSSMSVTNAADLTKKMQQKIEEKRCTRKGTRGTIEFAKCFWGMSKV